MAKRKRVLPARKQELDRSRDESLLMRSAETLGRMIGTLQRQLDGATKRLTKTAGDITSSKRKTGKAKTSARKASARTAAGSRKPGAARKRTANRSPKKR